MHPRPMSIRASILLTMLAPVLAVGACHRRGDHVHVAPAPRLARIQVEVYDPVTNFVWEGVAVRVVEAAQEWSGRTHQSPHTDRFLYSDRTGTVVFDALELGDADVGFLEDEFQRAVLSADPAEDEAYVLLELSAPGFTTVFTEVKLTYRTPDVFVAVPFQD